MQEMLVDAGGMRLSVRDHAGGSPPLLCLHGLASNARWWDLVAARLAPRHRVVAVDQRGHGRSDRPDSGYDFGQLSRDVAAVAAALHLGPSVVVGHSWGASVALSYAVDHPGEVLGVALVDGGVVDLSAIFGGGWQHAEERMTPPDLDGLREEDLRGWVASSPLSEGSDVETAVEIVRGNFEDAGPGRLRPRLTRTRHMTIARELYHLAPGPLLDAVRVPVLVIPAADSDDAIAGPRRAAVEEALGRLGDRGSVVWVPGGHDLPVQRPDEVAAALSAFAARVGGGGGEPRAR